MVPDSLASQLKESYEQAECVYFLSPENAQKTQLMLGCVLPNIKYVNNPFNFNQELVGFEGDEANYSLACVAALKSFHKGQDILLSVLGQDKWKARNICLNFYGEGVNREQLKRLVQIYGLEDKVSFLGFESNKHAIWAHNMGCIMPSRMEGQSLAMLEAMSFGRMVISTKVGDAERLIEHGKTGFLVDFPSFEVLDRVMDEAWNLRDQWLSMGKYSRQKLFKEIPINPIEFFADCIKTHL
jgi:glycosyltransferase involved in cell wall biosynthesis